MTSPTNNTDIESRIQTGRKYVWVVAILFTIAFAWQMISLFMLTAPAKNGVFTLQKSGQHTLFVEATLSTPAHPFQITATTTGAICESTPPEGERALKLENVQYLSVGHYSIPVAGAYALTTNNQPFLGAAIVTPPVTQFFFISTCGFVLGTLALLITEIKLMLRARAQAKANARLPRARILHRLANVRCVRIFGRGIQFSLAP